MHSEPQVETRLVEAAQTSQRQAFLLVAGCLLVVLATFGQTFSEMVRIWSTSQTFAHGFLVLPAFLYFVWHRRTELTTIPVRPNIPAALLVAAMGFAWLLSEVASALTPGFFAMIAAVPLVVVAVLGRQWALAITFPLGFLFFAVPFGEVFVPALMEWTADFTVAAVRLSGVPVFREGQDLIIPSGRWSVVEACSGIRYLLASVFVGSLYAWLMYRSPLRRWLFFAASIVVPIVANWLRAYMIVMLGHLSGNSIAVGVDHLIYGWVFFGIVIAILFAVGATWREDGVAISAGAAGIDSARAVATLQPSWNRVAVAAAAAGAALVVWPVIAAFLMRPYEQRSVPEIRIAPAGGWTVANATTDTWRPSLQAAASERQLIFEKDGQQVGLFVGLFRDQRQGSELVTSMNTVVGDAQDGWVLTSEGSHVTTINGRTLTVRVQRIRGTDGRSISIWRWYWLRDSWTASDWRAKVNLAFDRLQRRDDTSAWIAAYVRDPADSVTADELLGRFLRDMGGSLNSGLSLAARR